MLYNDGRAEYIHREGCEYIEKRKMGRRNNINSTQQLVPVVFFYCVAASGKRGGNERSQEAKKKGQQQARALFVVVVVVPFASFFYYRPPPFFCSFFFLFPLFISSPLPWAGAPLGKESAYAIFPSPPLLARLIHCCWHESLPPLLQLE